MMSFTGQWILGRPLSLKTFNLNAAVFCGQEIFPHLAPVFLALEKEGAKGGHYVIFCALLMNGNNLPKPDC